MRAHPWRNWLGAHLRGLADAVDPGGHDGASGRVTARDGVTSVKHAIGDAGEPELIRGMNLAGAPEHWARLVRESASQGGTAGVAVRPAALPDPARVAPPDTAPAAAVTDPPAAALHAPPPPSTAVRGAEQSVAPVPAVPAFQDDHRPDAGARSIRHAASGVSPSVAGDVQWRTGTVGPRLMLRPPPGPLPGPPPWTAPEARQESMEVGSTGPSASGQALSAKIAAVPTSARLAMSPRVRSPTGQPPSPVAPRGGTPRGDPVPAPPHGPATDHFPRGNPPAGNQVAPAAAGRGMPAAGTTGDISNDRRRATRAADSTTLGRGSAAPDRAVPAPTMVPSNDRLPLREASPAEPGRWPELPARPAGATVQPAAALARMLTRTDRLNQEQAAV